MPKHIIPPKKSLLADKDTQILHFLQVGPYLTFSDKGLANIASRFKISVKELKERIAEFEAGKGMS